MIKLFTHTDLDGVSCSILLRLMFTEHAVDVTYCNYDDVNGKIEDFLLNELDDSYERIFITDISVNEKVAKMLDTIKTKIHLLDHHKNLECLNEYDWVTIDTTECGTSLLYKHIGVTIDKISEFVEAVKAYDLWTWKTQNLLLPKKLNDVFHILGADFVDIYLEHISKSDMFTLRDEDLNLLKYFDKMKDDYIEKKLAKTSLFSDSDGHTFGFVFADNHLSELGNAMCEKLFISYSVIYTGKTLSFRSIGNFDVSKIAKKFGGGGHLNAAGAVVSNLINLDVITLPKYNIDYNLSNLRIFELRKIFYIFRQESLNADGKTWVHEYMASLNKFEDIDYPKLELVGFIVDEDKIIDLDDLNKYLNTLEKVVHTFE